MFRGPFPYSGAVKAFASPLAGALPDCVALSVLPEPFAEAETLGRNSEEPGRISLAASGSSIPWVFQKHKYADCKESELVRRGQRHEVIDVHGYDIRAAAAMHVIRLLSEGVELMSSGTITLPRPEKELPITIRTGQYGSLERVLTLANTLFLELEQADPTALHPRCILQCSEKRLCRIAA